MKPSRARRITKALIEWTTDDNQALRVAENERPLKFVATLEGRATIPCRTTMQKQVFEIFTATEAIVKGYFAEPVIGRAAFTTDCWSDILKNGYITITLHWIDAEWELNNILLQSACLPHPHSANVLCDLIMDTLQNWDLCGKIIAGTTDNGSNIVAVMRQVRRCINKKQQNFLLPEDWKVQCLAHCINLGVNSASALYQKRLRKSEGS